MGDSFRIAKVALGAACGLMVVALVLSRPQPSPEWIAGLDRRHQQYWGKAPVMNSPGVQFAIAPVEKSGQGPNVLRTAAARRTPLGQIPAQTPQPAPLNPPEPVTVDVPVPDPIPLPEQSTTPAPQPFEVRQPESQPKLPPVQQSQPEEDDPFLNNGPELRAPQASPTGAAAANPFGDAGQIVPATVERPTLLPPGGPAADPAPTHVLDQPLTETPPAPDLGNAQFAELHARIDKMESRIERLTNAHNETSQSVSMQSTATSRLVMVQKDTMDGLKRLEEQVRSLQDRINSLAAKDAAQAASLDKPLFAPEEPKAEPSQLVTTGQSFSDRSTQAALRSLKDHDFGYAEFSAPLPVADVTRYSFRFNEAEPRHVFSLLGRLSGRRIEPATEITEPLTLNLRDVTVDEALTAISEQYGWTCRHERGRAWAMVTGPATSSATLVEPVTAPRLVAIQQCGAIVPDHCYCPRCTETRTRRR